jgi:uncharacterized delta-60 repeat protein
VDGEWELIHVNEQVSNDWVALFDTTPAEGEAEPFVDYGSDGMRLEFPIDVNLAVVAIPIIDDIETEPTEFFGVLLSNPEAGYIEEQGTATVGIIDDECSFELVINSMEAPENGGPVLVEVRRNGGVVNPVTIEYDVVDGTAENRVDYLKGAGRINFDAGQETAFIVIPIVDDIKMEGLETFELNLTAAVVDPDIALEGSAILGEATNIGVTIVDDEMPGGVDPGFKLKGGANGPVFAILVDQDQRILLGGNFTRVGGVNYGHMSRLHPDGYVDSSFNVGTGLDDIVWSLGVQADRKPVPGGRYENIDGNPVVALGRLNADGLFDDTFGIDVGVDGEVFAVAVQPDGGIVIGGDFKKVAGVAVKNIARLNPDGTLDPTFAVGSGADKPVRDIAIQDDGKLVVVGEFGVLSGAAFGKVARLNPDGTADAEFTPGMGANGIVHSLGLQQDGGIIVAGLFTTFDGKDYPYVARLLTNGTLDEEWGGAATGINGAVFDVGTMSDGKVIIGGGFTEVGGYSRNSFARLHFNGEVDRNFEPGEGANGPVFTVAIQPDGNILLGGQFTQVGGYEQNNITRVFGGEQYALGRVEFKTARIEYNEGEVAYELEVIRSGKVQEPVTVQYKSVSGTAEEGEDFTAVSGEINFEKGGSEAIITVSLLDDELAEGNESFTIELTSEAVGIDPGGRTSVEVAIIDDESSAGFDQFAFEVGENVSEVVIMVNRSGGLIAEATAAYTIQDGSAKVGEDYTAESGVLTFAEGAASASILIGILEDLIEEPTEDFTVTLSDPSGGLTLVGELTATVTLVDNDHLEPGLTTFEAGMIPPDSGWSSSGSWPWYAQTAQVFEGSYALRSGKIEDAQESILVVEKETGAGTGYFHVKVSSEQDWDYLEFSLNGSALGKWSGRVDWKKFEFPLQAGLNRLVWSYRKDSGTFAGMDAAFIDNVFLPEPPPVEPPAITQLTGSMSVVEGESVELFVTAVGSEPLAYQWSKGGEALDEEINPTLALNSIVPSDAGEYTVAVSNSAGQMESDVITVTVVQPASIVLQPEGGRASHGETVTLNVVAAGTEPISYQWYYGDELIEGATESTLLLADLEAADSGAYHVVVSNLAGTETSDTVTLTVEKPYPLGRVEFKTARIEYNEGEVAYELEVIRSGKVQEPVTVQYKSVSGTAEEGEDFTAVSGEINFEKGGSEATITVSLLDDALAEGSESFAIELTSEAEGIDLRGQISVEVVMIDDEGSAGFDQLAFEVDESVGELVLVVNRFGGFGVQSAVAYTVQDGSAKLGEDYVAESGVLIFAEGAASASILIGIVDNLFEEQTEDLTVTLSDPSEGLTLVGDLTATVTLVDNDQPAPGLTTFEFGMIPPDSGWSSSGSWPWYAQTAQVFEGGYALRSGKIEDAQESILVVEKETGSGTGYFHVKVSSEQDWDYLEFSLNGSALGKWSGRIDWEKFEFPLQAGMNRLVWSYRKDPRIFSGMDAAFIDNVFLPPVEPPAITQLTESMSVFEGDSVELSVTVVGSEPLAYQWSKGGEELEGATDSRLTLADVVPSDAGDYVVAVSNSAGRVESDVITVAMAQPASIVTQPEGGSASHGETVTLNVVAAGTEPISYQWYHGDELVEGATESTLLMADLQAEDSGTYHVVVSNRAGTETSDTVTLTVEIQGPETRPILTVVGITAEGLQLSVTGDAATEYELQFSTDLKSWSTLANVVTDDTGKAVLTDAANAETLAKETWAEATGFYRAVLVVGDGGE